MKCFPSGSTTTQCAGAAYRAGHAEPCRNRRGTPAPSVEDEGVTVSLCHQCIVGTLDAGYRRGLFARGALVVAMLGLRRILCDQRRRSRLDDADDHPGTGPQSIPDQRIEVAGGRDRGHVEPRRNKTTSALDDRYDTAVQNLQNAQSALQTITRTIVRTKAQVAVDRKHLTNDAVKAYIYGTPQSSFAALFSSSATMGEARNQYTQQIVGNLDKARDALQTSEASLVSQQVPRGVAGGPGPEPGQPGQDAGRGQPAGGGSHRRRR